MAKTKGADPSLSQLLATLASDKPRADKLCRLVELQAEADKAGASPAGTLLYLRALLALLGEVQAEADKADKAGATTRSGVGRVAAGGEAAG